MRKSLRTAVIASAVVAAGIGLTAAPAMAGPPFTVSGANADGSASGASDNTNLVLKRGGSPVDTLTCDLSEVTANITNGSKASQLGTITGSTWTGCRDSQFDLTFSVSHVGTWSLDGISGPVGGVTTGAVSNVTANISGPLCTATFSGTAPGRYDNSGVLTMDPTAGTNTLHVTAASCLGIIQVNDTAEFSGDYGVDPLIQIS
jgi:hypothetical protein